ncbi:MAG: hypothetical protein ABIA47_00465 [bacterium]
MLSDRQSQILSAIIEHYVKTAQPVASQILVNKFSLGCSSATVRNTMVALEDFGLLRQPHTSAGRVPTEEGFRLYVEQFMQPAGSMRPRAPLVEARQHVGDPRDIVRKIAKCLVELSGETAFSSMDSNQNYYTGISNLFDKPEFGNVDTLRELSGIIDKFDDVLNDVFERVDRDVSVWIGEQSPFGSQMTTMLVKYKMPGGFTGIMGLVGPLRMDYGRNMKLLREAKKLLDEEL